MLMNLSIFPINHKQQNVWNKCVISASEIYQKNSNKPLDVLIVVWAHIGQDVKNNAYFNKSVHAYALY